MVDPAILTTPWSPMRSLWNTKPCISERSDAPDISNLFVTVDTKKLYNAIRITVPKDRTGKSVRAEIRLVFSYLGKDYGNENNEAEKKPKDKKNSAMAVCVQRTGRRQKTSQDDHDGL